MTEQMKMGRMPDGADGSMNTRRRGECGIIVTGGRTVLCVPGWRRGGSTGDSPSFLL